MLTSFDQHARLSDTIFISVFGSSLIMLLQNLFNTVISCVLLTTSSTGAKPCIGREQCYQIVDTKITWAKASRICKEDNGHLIFIETAEEQQFIADQMQTMNFTAAALWIGSANVHAEDGPRWDNGDNFSYVNWAGGQPNSPPAVENCAEMYTNNGFKWNDRLCKHQRGYICEKTDVSEPCMTVGYIRHCYQIVQTKKTWTEASDICSQDGGMLVTIESDAEQKFIIDQMKNINFTMEALWIGADKLHPNNQRTWANGQQFEYTNWARGEPNNKPLVENCTEMTTSDYTWNDAICSIERGYICEYPRGPHNNRNLEHCAELSTSDCTWSDEMCSSERGYICKNAITGTSDPQVWAIIVPVGSALILLVGVLFLYCFFKKRRKNQKKKVEVYQGLQEMEMRNAEHIYNEHIHLSDAYCTIDDYSSRPDDLTHRK